MLPAANDKPAKLESKFDLIDYMTSIDCFMRSLRITNDYDEPVDLPIYATRNKVHLLMSWLLPGLYGLLGACVYVMRDLLRGNGSSKAGGDARIVELLSLLLRVSLGGLAGIIIGWFSVPTAPTASSAAISISSIPFGMAFLAGFSIEMPVWTARPLEQDHRAARREDARRSRQGARKEGVRVRELLLQLRMARK